MQRDRLDDAATLMRQDPYTVQDDRLTYLAYARCRHEEALDRIDAIEPDAIKSRDAPFTMLVKASALKQIGRLENAKACLKLALARLPKDVRTVSALRPAYYALPPRSWVQFENDLQERRDACLTGRSRDSEPRSPSRGDRYRKHFSKVTR